MGYRDAPKHEVKRGETLSGIARRYNVSVKELVRWNDEITDPNKIRVGQKIAIDHPALYRRKTAYYGGVLPEVVVTAKYLGTRRFGVDIARQFLGSSTSLIDTYLELNNADYHISLARNNQFLGKTRSGVERVMDNSFLSNKRDIERLTPVRNAYQANANRLGGIRTTGGVGNWLNVGLGSYQIATRQADAITYVDTGVGLTGIVAGSAGYFAGVKVPYVGKAVAYYGICRTTWDVFFYLGANYGPVSTLTRLYRQRQDEKRRKERSQSVILDNPHLLQEYKK
jgi:LysM repeat protein